MQSVPGTQNRIHKELYLSVKANVHLLSLPAPGFNRLQRYRTQAGAIITQRLKTIESIFIPRFYFLF